MDILVYKDGRMVCTENPLKADSLEGLAMLVTNPQDGDVLKYDAASGTWLNGTGSDFAPTITSPQDGQVIKYNGTAWVNGAESGGFAPDITNPQDGQVLVYDGTAGKWVNGAGGGSGGGYLKVTSDPKTNTLDKTWNEIYNALGDGKFVSIVCVYPDGHQNVQDIIVNACITDGSYEVYTNEASVFSTDSANGYPTLET